MINLGVIFGGRSCEHDVSIITGQQLIQNVDKTKYNVVPVYISNEGKWYTGKSLLDVKFFNEFNPLDKDVQEVHFNATPNVKGLTYLSNSKGLFSSTITVETIPLDVVIIAIHGLNGEDGTVAGLMELSSIPYGNTPVMGSAVGMDKIAMKSVFKSHGFPVLEDLYFERNDYIKNIDKVLSKIMETLSFPVFVKPANLGSSIGIKKATDKISLENALNVAFSYDRRVLVEKAVENLVEVNCAALGYSDEITVSMCEMPVSWEGFLSFDDKYMRGTKSSKGMESLQRKIPAPISEEKTEEIKGLTNKIFKALDCKGVVRIDYLIDKDLDKVFVGEINTQPGSFSFYLFEPMGISYGDLIEKIIKYAFKAYEDKSKNNFAYDSEILSKVSIAKGSKTGGKLGKTGKI